MNIGRELEEIRELLVAAGDSSPLMTTLENAHLSQKYEKLVDAGELPYEENQKALKAFDVDKDREAGKKALKKMNAGIDAWIKKLEQFSNVSGKISQRAIALRQA